MATPNERLQRRQAAASRWHGPDSPITVGIKQELKAAKLEAYVSKVVSEAPELSPDQLARVAALLRPRTLNGDAA